MNNICVVTFCQKNSDVFVVAVAAMNNLYTNWSGTPNPEGNLQGWGPINMTMTNVQYGLWWFALCAGLSWKGVECFTIDASVPGYIYNCNGTELTTTYRITDL
jgi:hypothetical protein